MDDMILYRAHLHAHQAANGLLLAYANHSRDFNLAEAEKSLRQAADEIAKARPLQPVKAPQEEDAQ